MGNQWRVLTRGQALTDGVSKYHTLAAMGRVDCWEARVEAGRQFKRLLLMSQETNSNSLDQGGSTGKGEKYLGASHAVLPID